jgi:hypothetical protein
VDRGQIISERVSQQLFLATFGPSDFYARLFAFE